MQHIIAHVDAYDRTHYGIPWAAPSDSSGRPSFKGKVAHYTGIRGGSGDLFVEGPIAENSIWVCGQKDYRQGHSTKAYLVFRDGEFCPLLPEAVTEALLQAPRISSDDARRDELISILMEELIASETAQTPPSLCDIMVRRNITEDEVHLYKKKSGDHNV